MVHISGWVYQFHYLFCLFINVTHLDVKTIQNRIYVTSQELYLLELIFMKLWRICNRLSKGFDIFASQLVIWQFIVLLFFYYDNATANYLNNSCIFYPFDKWNCKNRNNCIHECIVLSSMFCAETITYRKSGLHTREPVMI